MLLLNIPVLLVNSQPVSINKATSSLFTAIFTIAVFMIIQFLGVRIYTNFKERHTTSPIYFIVAIGALALISLLGSFLPADPDNRLFLAVVGGLLFWTSLGEIGENIGWYSPHSRQAVWAFLLLVAVWLALAFIATGIPVHLLAFLGYPLLAWGTQITRVRVLDKWGTGSLASTILLLVMASFGGGVMVLGALVGTKLSGMIAGLIFANTAWSVLEIIWERGMARGPWKTRSQ